MLRSGTETTPLPGGSGGRRRPRGAGGHSDVRKVLERLFGPDAMKEIVVKGYREKRYEPLSDLVVADPQTWWCGTAARTVDAANGVLRLVRVDTVEDARVVVSCMANCVARLVSQPGKAYDYDGGGAVDSVGGVYDPTQGYDGDNHSLFLRIRPWGGPVVAVAFRCSRDGYIKKFMRGAAFHNAEGPAQVCTYGAHPREVYYYDHEKLGEGEEGKEALWRKLGKGRLTKRAVA